MSAAIHHADWSIPYPVQCDADSIPSLLQPFTLVEHAGEACPWHLTTKALNLLETPQACYEYLHLVWFFRARAAMLALEGSVLDHHDLFRALSKHRVQVAGIYREHLIFHVRDFLRKQNLAGLPVCHCENRDAIEDNAKVDQNRQILRAIIRTAEIAFLGTMNFISAATTMKEKVARHTVGFWASGGRMPATLGVTGRVRRFRGGYVVRPIENDVKRMVLEGTPLRTIVVRGAESGKGEAGSEERGAESGGAGHAGQKSKAAERANATTAQKAAEIALATVAPALRCSKLNPDRGARDDLVQAFSLERKKHATDGETFTALARLDIETARKTPDKAPWMRLSDANRHYSRAVRGEAMRADDVATRAVALERRYRRALRDAASGKRPPGKT